MADLFVSDVVGDNTTGLAWETAKTSGFLDWGSLLSDPAVDTVWIRNDHDEEISANSTITGESSQGSPGKRVSMICVTGADTGTSKGSLSSGAVLSAGPVGVGAYDVNFAEDFYFYGIHFKASDNIENSNDPEYLTFENCIMELTGSSSNDRIIFGGSGRDQVVMKNCQQIFANAGQIMYSAGAGVRMEGGSVGASGTVPSALIRHGINNQIMEYDGVDLSALATNISTSGINRRGHVKLTRCKLHASVTKLDGGQVDVPGFWLDFVHCDDGTSTDPEWQDERYHMGGRIMAVATPYRTGGASDGVRTNPYSLEYDQTSTYKVFAAWPGHPLIGPWLSARTGTGGVEHTYDIYIASDATQQDDDAWVEWLLPDDTTDDVLPARVSSMVLPLGTPANLDTDSSSTWNGSGVGTKQRIRLTYTPKKEGVVTARLHVATEAGGASKIYQDPAIWVDE